MPKKTKGQDAREAQHMPDAYMSPAQRRYMRWGRYQQATNAQDAILRLMTDRELAHLYNRVWDAMTYYDGYQAFGWDRPTLIARGDGHGLKALDALDREAKRRGLSQD